MVIMPLKASQKPKGKMEAIFFIHLNLPHYYIL